MHGVFVSSLTISPVLAQTYHFHVYMSLSRPTIPIKSVLAHIFHYKDQIQQKWFVKFWRYQRTPAVLGRSLQGKLVVLIITVVSVQQLQRGRQRGALGLVSRRRSGRWVGCCWPHASPAGERHTSAVSPRATLGSLQRCGRGLEMSKGFQPRPSGVWAITGS